MELFEEIRREYRYGVGTIQGRGRWFLVPHGWRGLGRPRLKRTQIWIRKWFIINGQI